jgi:hypothetical protein
VSRPSRAVAVGLLRGPALASMVLLPGVISMVERLVALIGPGNGPQVHVKGFREPVLRIRQLTCGGHVVVVTDGQEQIITESGDHTIPEARWLQCRHVGKSKKLTCVVTGKAS